MKAQRILVTGGAGFIGSNLVNRLLTQGHEVIIYDNLSRPGCQHNLCWLRQQHGTTAFALIQSDLANERQLQRAASGVQRIYHLAAQVAVTSSITNPRQDFTVNALGTFNVLEAARQVADDPIVIYASTNKVYGALTELPICEEATRYTCPATPYGIAETYPLDFHSPYGCSKGTGDQYTRDYARIYGLRSVVVRQSCIYGDRQFGLEDQGWLAWFMIAALRNYPITIYGNGKQVRDALFIDDLLDCYDAIVEQIEQAAGQTYNIGGGPTNSISIWSEFGGLLASYLEAPIPVRLAPWRPGDQPVYISDIRKAQADLGWAPRVPLAQGIQQLFEWVKAHQCLFAHFAH